MKVHIFEVESWEQERFNQLKDEHSVDFTTEALSKNNATSHSDAEAISTFIYSSMGKEVLEQFKNLKLIATRSTGFDHIDLDYCRDNGIVVCNVPSYGENTVAEHVFGLLMLISHHLMEAVDRTRKGDFSQRGLQGFDLREKTLGVIGTGDIGRCVIQISKGYRMNVVAFDVIEDDEFAREMGFEYVPMDQLLEQSDIITLHVPENEKTHHLLSRDEFKKMKDGVILINTARGGVVEVNALIEALATGKVAAAGLDVLPEEPVIREEAELLRSFYQKEHNLDTLLADHILLRLKNVYITPHSAFNTKEAVMRILETTVENIEKYAGGQPRNVVGDTGKEEKTRQKEKVTA
jgi:D-lactate dehydrogenase